MKEATPLAITKADRLAALNHHGYKEEADLSYWGRGSDMQQVDETAKLLAHHRATALADMQRRVDELEAENAALRRVIHVSKGPSPENVEIVQSAFDRGWSIPLDPPEWPEMLAQAQEFLAARQALSDKAKDKNDG